MVSSPISREIPSLELWSEQWGRRSPTQQHTINHKSHPHFPSAKAHWLPCLPIPEPAVFTAYLKSGNPQEMQAREAVRKQPPALAGLFLQGTFHFAATLFSALACLLAVGVCWNQKWRKSSWNSPWEQKGFCAGGFGGRGCFPTSMSDFPVPRSTWPWQSRGGMGRRWAEQGLGSARAQEHMGRDTDTSHTCQQCQSSTEAQEPPKYSCIVAQPSLCAGSAPLAAGKGLCSPGQQQQRPKKPPGGPVGAPHQPHG